MRKVTKDTAAAFWAGRSVDIGNSAVRAYRDTGVVDYFLHGNRIASRATDHIYITDCGWQTALTKERLNGILQAIHCGIGQEKGKWWFYLPDGSREVFAGSKMIPFTY
jgi:hypothetical protein